MMPLLPRYLCTASKTAQVIILCCLSLYVFFVFRDDQYTDKGYRSWDVGSDVTNDNQGRNMDPATPNDIVLSDRSAAEDDFTRPTAQEQTNMSPMDIYSSDVISKDLPTSYPSSANIPWKSSALKTRLRFGPIRFPSESSDHEIDVNIPIKSMNTDDEVVSQSAILTSPYNHRIENNLSNNKEISKTIAHVIRTSVTDEEIPIPQANPTKVKLFSLSTHSKASQGKTFSRNGQVVKAHQLPRDIPDDPLKKLGKIYFQYYDRYPRANLNSSLLQNTSLLRKMFRHLLTKFEKQTLRNLLSVLRSLCSQLGIPMFLYGGSLLGSYRHHDIIPWDDDLDVMVPFKFRKQLHQGLCQLYPQLSVNQDNPACWKFFFTDGQRIRHFPWRYPFLDIFFYESNDTHIWDIHPSYIRDYVFPKRDVFPLTSRPFLGLSYPVPKDTGAVLAKTYRLDECSTNLMVHKWDIYKNSTSVPCQVLKPFHAFVERDRLGDSGACTETLEYMGHTIHTFVDYHCQI